MQTPNVAERIPQSIAIRVQFYLALTSDHVAAATGKTVAITISKNGAAFGNPSAGATNATEIASGWYYVDLSTTDTGTLGPLAVRGTAASSDDAAVNFRVVDPVSAGFDGALADPSQATPSATPSWKVAVMALYSALRNKKTVSGGQKYYYNDAGTVVYKSAVSDDGSTATEDELVSGP